MVNSTMTWPTKPLGKVARIERSSVTPENIRNGSIYVGLENITGEGGFDSVREVTNGELASNKFEFTPSHVLYGKLRPYLSKIARPDFSGICSTDILPVLAGKEIDRDFLYYFLRQPEMVQHATMRSTGANLPRLSPTQLAEFPVPVPKLEEQKRIAAILDKAAAIRHKRQVAIQTLRDLIPAQFIHEFGDPNSNPYGWDKVLLPEIAKDEKHAIVDGPFGASLKKEEFVDDGVPIIRINNIRVEGFFDSAFMYITEAKYNELLRSKVQPQDLLIARVGHTIGKSCIFNQTYKALLSTTGLCKVTINEEVMHPLFLVTLWNLPAFQSYVMARVRGAAQPYLNLTTIKSFEVILPPLDQQMRFVRFVEKANELLEKQITKCDMDDDLFNSLVQRAFKGEL